MTQQMPLIAIMQHDDIADDTDCNDAVDYTNSDDTVDDGGLYD